MTLNPLEIKIRATRLYDIRQTQAISIWNWLDGSKERAKLIRQVRNLAKKIPIDVTFAESEELSHAMMYLDVIALRENINLEYGPKRSKQNE